MHFSVSIEFWGDKNDYLRYGSKWDDIMNNVRKFKEHDVKISWHSTVNALNIGYLNEMPVKQSFVGLVEGLGEIYSVASVLTTTSRAANDVIRPTPIFQSKPRGAIMGSIILPICPA